MYVRRPGRPSPEPTAGRAQASLSSATLHYGVGRLLGRDGMRRLGGRRTRRVRERVRERLQRAGILGVASVRLVPVAPFLLINLVAGAVKVKLRSFVLGTLLGMLPGLIALTLVGSQLGAAIEDPQSGHIGPLLTVGLAAILAAVWLRRRLVMKRQASV